MELAEKELGMPTDERDVGRTELYAADEVFLTGTGFQIAPVTEIDDRKIGTGEMGPVVSRLQREPRLHRLDGRRRGCTADRRVRY